MSFPNRPPKKFTEKSLHGRTRFALTNYNDFRTFQRFYTNVFGWDMFEVPVASGGKTPGDPQPNLLVATGPSYETWEGVVPGHMNCMAGQSESGKPEPFSMFTECHMDRPILETIREVLENGGSVVGEMPTGDSEGWLSQVMIADPCGNVHKLWKCPDSRTWEEPEAGYDEAE